MTSCSPNAGGSFLASAHASETCLEHARSVKSLVSSPISPIQPRFKRTVGNRQLPTWSFGRATLEQFPFQLCRTAAGLTVDGFIDKYMRLGRVHGERQEASPFHRHVARRFSHPAQRTHRRTLNRLRAKHLSGADQHSSEPHPAGNTRRAARPRPVRAVSLNGSSSTSSTRPAALCSLYFADCLRAYGTRRGPLSGK